MELLVSSALLMIMLGLILGIANHTSKAVHQSMGQLDAFQRARLAFDTLSQKLSQATLNTYWEYDNPTNPTRYLKHSDLHFLVKTRGHGQALYFQVPAAHSAHSNLSQTRGMLNACAYYVEFGNDDAVRPQHVSTKRWRYRLMQSIQPAEEFKVYTEPGLNWVAGVEAKSWPLADNVIALIVWPRLRATEDADGTELSPDYQYDSRDGSALQQAQLPPVVRVTLVVLNEASAARLDQGATPPAVIENALNGKFLAASGYAAELADLETALTSAHLQYEVLDTTVSLEGAKWTR